MPAVYDSKKSNGRQKTYGKSGRTHISGLFGRSLWADVGPTQSKVPEPEFSKNRTKKEAVQSGGSKSDDETDIYHSNSTRPHQQFATAQSDKDLGTITESLADIYISETATVEKLETPEIIIEENTVISSSASSIKESSDKENERLSPLKPKSRGLPPVNSASPEKCRTVSPRSVLGERNSLEIETVTTSPPRKRGLRKRPSGLSCRNSSPLKHEIATKQNTSDNSEGSLHVWEDDVEEIFVFETKEVIKKEYPLEKATIDENGPYLKILDGETHGNDAKAKGVSRKREKKVLTDEVLLSKAVQTEVVMTIPDQSSRSDLKLSPIEQLLKLCTKPDILEFNSHINSMLEISSIWKLGEASYSEVFLQSSRGSNSSTVLKIIPFGKEDQCEIGSITQEVHITKVMGEIEGFIGFRGAYVVKGRFPETLMDEWDAFDEERGSENERPDFYEDEQLFAIILLENGGTDLEHTNIYSWEEAFDVFWQVTHALAMGEKEREFEVKNIRDFSEIFTYKLQHRDLHWGNIVLRRISENNPIENNEQSPGLSLENLSLDITENSSYKSDLKVALIDYTLSRAWCGVHPKDRTYEFVSLDDPALFTGKGDYQFDIYRLMQSHLSSKSTNTEGGNLNWNIYIPRTNLFWLHYLTNILLTKCGLTRPAARGRNAASEREIVCFKHLEAISKKIDPRKKLFGKQVVLENARSLVEWAICEEILEK